MGTFRTSGAVGRHHTNPTAAVRATPGRAADLGRGRVLRVSEEPRVEVTADGPYRVVGDLPLVRTAQVETEYGEPVAWEPDAPLEPPPAPYELCRCGRSSRKPFCDATHEREPFDGMEVADRRDYDERAYPYRGRRSDALR